MGLRQRRLEPDVNATYDFRNVISREHWTSASIASLRSFKTSEGTIIPVLGCGELARVAQNLLLGRLRLSL